MDAIFDVWHPLADKAFMSRMIMHLSITTELVHHLRAHVNYLFFLVCSEVLGYRVEGNEV